MTKIRRMKVAQTAPMASTIEGKHQSVSLPAEPWAVDHPDDMGLCNYRGCRKLAVAGDRRASRCAKHRQAR